jgi:hypothetical protein
MAIYKGNTKLDANGLQVSSVPAGSIVQYDGDTIPTGYEEVNGFDNYSTTEQRIGTWIDGKPIYRKTFEINGAGSNVSDDILASLDIEVFLKSEWLSWGNGDFIIKNVGYNSSTKKLVNKPAEWSVAFTVEYTKTTDSAS